jgi:hypothetical protein
MLFQEMRGQTGHRHTGIIDERSGTLSAHHHTQGRNKAMHQPTAHMDRPASQREEVKASTAFTFQRISLAACIILAPLSITLYLVTWVGNQRAPLTPLITSAMAGPTGNTLHFIGAIAASFFLPLGYLGMSLLGMRRAPWLATISAALSLVGWIPWPALMGLDALAYDINQVGLTPQLAALWTHFNGDVVLTIYLLIYIIGHLTSAVLIGIMLGRLHIIPFWAAWAFALTSPLTIVIILVHNLVFQDVLKYLTCTLWIIGAVPAALQCSDIKTWHPSRHHLRKDTTVFCERARCEKFFLNDFWEAA